MTTPINPNPLPPNQPPSIQMPPMANPDPSGTWAKFLGGSGGPASPEEVRMFVQGLLKMFNVMIQQEQKRAKEASEKLKRAAEGEDIF